MKHKFQIYQITPLTWLVNSHTKRHRCDNDAKLITHPSLLPKLTLPRLETCVVEVNPPLERRADKHLEKRVGDVLAFTF